jgi:undecaprenyl-diphosphatase
MQALLTPAMDFTVPGDLSLFHFLNSGGPRWVDWAFEGLSNPLFCLACAALATALLAARFGGKALRTVVIAWLALALSDGIGHLCLKPLLDRRRPCYALPVGTVRQLLPAADSGSMPSLHAANAFAFALPIALCWSSAGVAACALALLIGVSRIYVGVHWPSDVLVGALWGAAVSLAMWGLSSKLKRAASRTPTC